jgi:hypothetical protein
MGTLQNGLSCQCIKHCLTIEVPPIIAGLTPEMLDMLLHPTHSFLSIRLIQHYIVVGGMRNTNVYTSVSAKDQMIVRVTSLQEHLSETLALHHAWCEKIVVHHIFYFFELAIERKKCCVNKKNLS